MSILFLPDGKLLEGRNGVILIMIYQLKDKQFSYIQS